jgi:hypothetical protein
MAASRSLGTVPFTGGVDRKVFLDEDGRQFVVDGNGDPVYGVWILVDEPVHVARNSARS